MSSNPSPSIVFRRADGQIAGRLDGRQAATPPPILSHIGHRPEVLTEIAA
jgi:hypothetical protein